MPIRNSLEDDIDVRGRARREEAWTPRPDPTLLTTQQLQREISALKEILFTRLDGMDRAIVVFSDSLTRTPTEIQKQIQHLKELTFSKFEGDELVVAEKFGTVQKQFVERDVRVEQTAKDTKVAVDAALQAAEKAVSKQNEASSASIAKSELSTGKQIDQLGVLISTSIAALNDKIDDIKQRLTAIESAGRGGKAEHDMGRSNVALVMSVLGMLMSVAFLVVALRK